MDNEAKVDKDKSEYNTALDYLKQNFDSKLQALEEKYQGQETKLREDLEMKLKVEIHEIEERKNQHINDLMRNHDEAFSGLKSFYNDITAENLQLIRAQKQEIKEIQDRRKGHTANIAAFKAKNTELKKPLDEATHQRDELRDILKQFEKDKMSLSNLKIKLVSLRERYHVLVKEKRGLDGSYESCLAQKVNFLFWFTMKDRSGEPIRYDCWRDEA